jgi:WD40 repeat protein
MYTSLFYSPTSSTFTLVDELGRLELLSSLKEGLVASIQLVPVKQKQFMAISRSHETPALGEVKPYLKDGSFLVLIPSSGDICQFELIKDFKFKEFKGEDNAILNVFPLPYAVSSIRKRSARLNGVSSAVQLSREESLLLTIDTSSITCWDERDRKEVYQLRHKQKTEISCSCMLWALNTIVTGHEDGRVVLTNVDSSSKTTSNALSDPVSALCIAKYKFSDVLLGADYSGNLVVWSLGTLKESPFELPCELRLRGPHDEEDPAILCLAYHPPTSLIISGGNDGSICCYSLSGTFPTKRYTYCHKDSSVTAVICPDDCTSFSLVSADIAGCVVVWQIGGPEEGHELFPLAQWNSVNPTGLGTLIDAVAVTNSDSRGQVSVYIARTERSIGPRNNIEVRCIDFSRYREDAGERVEVGSGNLPKENGMYNCHVEEYSEYTIGIRRVCEMSCIDTAEGEGGLLQEGEPTVLRLISIEDGTNSLPSGVISHDDTHKEDDNGYEEMRMPCPSVLYLGRTTGTTFRYELQY